MKRGDGKAPRGSRKAHGEAPKRLRSVLRRRAGQGACLASRVRRPSIPTRSQQTASCACLWKPRRREDAPLAGERREKGRSSALWQAFWMWSHQGEGTGALQELGTPSCPYRFGCEAVSAELEDHVRHASEWTDVSVELAYMLMDARGEKRSHERLNEILNGALRACRKRSGKGCVCEKTDAA